MSVYALLALVLLATSALLGIVFAVTLGPPWNTQNPSMTWLQAALAWSAASIDIVLLLTGLHVHVPIWISMLILLGEDAVFLWRLGLLWRLRRALRPGATLKPGERSLE